MMPMFSTTASEKLPRGLPERLPEGERLLWQGAPNWRLLARHLFHVRGFAIYFAVLIAICVGLDVMDRTPLDEMGLTAGKLVGAALGALGFLTLYAWMISAATVYSITSHRVIIQLGLAVPMTINLPFNRIESAAINVREGGFGDVSLLLNLHDRLAYFVVWPHARPWRMARAEPMLRCIPDAARVGQVLARALAASAGMSAPAAPSAAGVQVKDAAPVAA